MANDQDFAVMAAVSRYPGWTGRDLEGPVHDLREFAEWLLDPTGGDIPPTNAPELDAWLRGGPPATTFGAASTVQFFVTPPPPDDATMTIANSRPITHLVEQAFTSLHHRAEARLVTGDRRLGRRLYIYFAGHGFAPDKRETALLMADATSSSPGFHVVGRAYADHFAIANIFDEVVLVMDCCREDNAVVPQRPIPFLTTKGAAPGKPFCALAAGWDQKSAELPSPNGGPKRGVFTRTLLEGLRGARRGGVVTSASLEAWVKARMPSTGSGQSPEFDFDRTGDGYLLCRPRQTVNLTIQVVSSAGAAVTLEGGPRNEKNIQPVRRQGDDWHYSLDLGLYVATLQATGATAVIRDSQLGGPIVQL